MHPKTHSRSTKELQHVVIQRVAIDCDDAKSAPTINRKQ
jgi:hypothetical protein